MAQSPNLKHDVTQWRWHSLFLLFRQWGFSLEKARCFADEGVKISLIERQKVSISSETHRLLAQFCAHFPLIAITNGNANIEKMGLDSYFSAAFYAGKDGNAKPDGDLFQLAKTFLDLPVKSILHVGDHPISDVKGAHQVGFQSAWLNETSAAWTHLDFAPTYTIKTLADLPQLLSIE